MKTKTNPLEALKSTGHKMYVDEEVAKTSPENSGEIELFTIGKYISDDDLKKEYESRGLVPAGITALCEYDLAHRDIMDEKHWVAIHWKDCNGKWCFAAFDQLDDDGRDVNVRRRGDDWHDGWWFAGVRKLVLNPSDTQNSLDTESLGLSAAIEIVKKAGYQVSKIM